MSYKTPIKTARIKIKLISGKWIQGNININGYARFTDFLEDHTHLYIKAYDCVFGNSETTPPIPFIAIPKTSIEYYIPIKEPG